MWFQREYINVTFVCVERCVFIAESSWLCMCHGWTPVSDLQPILVTFPSCTFISIFIWLRIAVSMLQCFPAYDHLSLIVIPLYLWHQTLLLILPWCQCYKSNSSLSFSVICGLILGFIRHWSIEVYWLGYLVFTGIEYNFGAGFILTFISLFNLLNLIKLQYLKTWKYNAFESSAYKKLKDIFVKINYSWWNLSMKIS